MNQEQILLGQIAAGDTDAFGTWMAAAEPRIRGSLRSFATSVDTEAVVQETLLRVWQVAHRVEDDGRPEVLIRLGVRIARNLAIDQARRNRREITVDMGREISIDELPVYACQHTDELREALGLCLETLPAKPRSAMSIRLSGATEDEATLAVRAGMTTNTFFQNIRRARKALAECLAKHGMTLGFKP